MWKKNHKGRPDPIIHDGDSLIENFFLTCDKFSKYEACADEIFGCVSFKQLKRFVIALANKIKLLPSERIGVMLPSSIGASVVIFAISLVGKIPFMINWTQGVKDIKFIRVGYGVTSVISSLKFMEKLDASIVNEASFEMLYLEHVFKSFSFFDKLSVLRNSYRSTKGILKYFNYKDTGKAVVLFTSGTENAPKAVPLSSKNIISNISASINLINPTSDDILISILPPFHAFGFAINTILPIVSGWRVVFQPNPLDGKKVCQLIDQYKATIFCGTPTFFSYMLRSAILHPESVSSLRLVILGGEPVLQSHYDDIKKINPKTEVLQGYGVTECSPVIAVARPGESPEGVGKVLDNLDVKIVHQETKAPLKNNESGLILVKGPSVFSGYLEENGQNKSSILFPFINIENQMWYDTGDLGHFSSNNNLILEGRLKRFVKIGGEMISLAALENMLLSVLKTDDDAGHILVIHGIEALGKKTKLWLITTKDIDIKEVNAILHDKGASNLIKIYAVKKVDAIPVLGIGKPAYADIASLI